MEFSSRLIEPYSTDIYLFDYNTKLNKNIRVLKGIKGQWEKYDEIEVDKNFNEEDFEQKCTEYYKKNIHDQKYDEETMFDIYSDKIQSIQEEFIDRITEITDEFIINIKEHMKIE